MLRRFSLRAAAIASFLAVSTSAHAQQPGPFAVDPNGMMLAQQVPAIEQTRLRQQARPPVNLGVDANGTATSSVEATSSDDDSFGAQQILKDQQRTPRFFITGGASLIYTNNVALAARGAKDDVFAVVSAGAHWTPRLAPNVEGSVTLHGALFRYDKTPELDFQNLGFGVGAAWTPPAARGATVFARYDLTELFGSRGRQILLDHVFTLGVQKSFALGRSHAITVGGTASVGFADPSEAQRDQLGAFLGYRLQVSRKLEMDFLLRPSVNLYNDPDRTDFNQILSWNLRYRFTDWAELSAFVNYGLNRSDRAAFDYNVFSSGAGFGLHVRF